MEINYKELGLKVGLEIHQQLDTVSKLFCSCPTSLATSDEPSSEIMRFLRVTKSEVGEIDPAALYEVRKGRRIHYVAPYGHTCLVELDEEPPHELNKEALVITIAIAKALGSKIADEIYVMRKIVVDGSNTTGFQRTAIVAFGGKITDEEGDVGIQTICLEEDAARKIEEGTGYVKYNLDRLGIPLIEIATAPDIKTPEQAMRVALKIGLLLRLTGKVKRGIGTIRQDLNISIKNGEKIEVKGVSKLELIPKVIKYEVMRQLKLLEIKNELQRRGLREEAIDSEIYDITDLFNETQSKLIKRALKKGQKVYAIKLRDFSGILGIEVQPGRRFGTELSDYAKAWGGVAGIIHSDELPGYGISENEVKKIYRKLELNPDRDAFVFVLADKEKATRALNAVLSRARNALKGIPRETRGANPDGTTKYLRPQPGAARMYPETDVPPVRVDKALLNEADKIRPRPPDELLKELIDIHGLSNELAKQLIRSPALATYLDLVNEIGKIVSPQTIATTLLIHIKTIKSEGYNTEKIEFHHLIELLKNVGEGKVAKEAIPEILKEVCLRPEAKIDEILSKFTGLTVQDLNRIVDGIINEYKDIINERGEKSFGLIMGRVMAKVRGRIDGKIVAEVVRSRLRTFLHKK